MKERILHVTISCILITISFFTGTLFQEKYIAQKNEKILSTQYRVDLSLTGKTIEVQKANENISIYMNGNLITKNTTIKQ